MEISKYNEKMTMSPLQLNISSLILSSSFQEKKQTFETLNAMNNSLGSPRQKSKRCHAEHIRNVVKKALLSND